MPWKDKKKYAKLMLEASRKSYQEAKSKNVADLVFFDRGILDSICYMKMEHIFIDKNIIDQVNRNSYNKKVFILPPWKEIYKKDGERKQNWEEAELTFNKMKETYVAFGYAVVEVPKVSNDKRVQFILENINR